MRKLLLTEQAGRLVRSLALSRVAENSRLLTRVDSTLPEATVKDLRREVDACIAISAQLAEGTTFVHVEVVDEGACDGNHGGPPCADSECWQREPPGPDSEVPAELRQQGVTLEQHRRALDPTCVHGKRRSEPCPDCERGEPVPPAGLETVG